MSRPHNRKQQKKLQKAKNKRESARRKRSAQAVRHTPEALIARAMIAPFGPCWISSALDQAPGAEEPALISVLVTRRVGGLLIPCMVLVDRTCLGVKNAVVGPPQTELDLETLRLRLSESGDVLRETDLLTAQSVIHHALDYAKSLGFAPHRDFVPELVGERPAVLLDTPLARPDRPLYVPGPEDDVRRVLARLDAGVGRGKYDVFSGVDDDAFLDLLDGLDDDDFDDEAFDDDDEAFGDDEVLTVEGSEVSAAAPPLAPDAVVAAASEREPS